MQLYLTISRGLRADLSTPIVAVSDQRLIRWLLSQFVLIAHDDIPCEPDCGCEGCDGCDDGRCDEDV